MRHVFLLTLSAVVTAVLLGGSAQAGSLVTPTGVALDASTQFFPIGNLVDDSGLSGIPTLADYTTITHSAASATTAWTTDDPSPPGGDYFAESPPNPVPMMTFSFDQAYDFTHVVSWGYHFGAPNGNEAKAITVEFSSDGGTTFPESADIVRTFSSADADTQYLGGTYTADTVRFAITDNFLEDAPGGDRVGLGEVKFLEGVVPEPSSICLLGMSLVGLVRLRRRRS